MNTCECCGKDRALKWVVIDDNYETEVCNSCIKELRKSCDVEVLMSV